MAVMAVFMGLTFQGLHPHFQLEEGFLLLQDNLNQLALGKALNSVRLYLTIILYDITKISPISRFPELKYLSFSRSWTAF